MDSVLEASRNGTKWTLNGHPFCPIKVYLWDMTNTGQLLSARSSCITYTPPIGTHHNLSSKYLELLLIHSWTILGNTSILVISAVRLQKDRTYDGSKMRPMPLHTFGSIMWEASTHLSKPIILYYKIEREMRVGSYHRRSYTIGLDLLQCVCRSGYPTVPNNKKQLLGSYRWIQTGPTFSGRPSQERHERWEGTDSFPQFRELCRPEFLQHLAPERVIPRGQFCPMATACVMQICSRPSAWYRFQHPCECPNFRGCRVLLL
jgi:hypothetical protein